MERKHTYIFAEKEGIDPGMDLLINLQSPRKRPLPRLEIESSSAGLEGSVSVRLPKISPPLFPPAISEGNKTRQPVFSLPPGKESGSDISLFPEE